MSKLSLVVAQPAAEVSEADGDLRAALSAVEQAGLELAARARSLRALGTRLHAGESRRGDFTRRFDAYQDALNQALAAQTRLRRLRSARGAAAVDDQAARPRRTASVAFRAPATRSRPPDGGRAIANRTHSNPIIL
jgi:hypothetical protein